MNYIMNSFLKKLSLISLTICFSCANIAAAGPFGLTAENKTRLGIWVTVFSEERVLSSTANADKLIRTAKETGVKDIYLQVYRSNNAYYDSKLTDRTAYEAMLKDAGEDTISYLLKQAKKNGLNVHAWINVLSIAKNKEADILKKYGPGVMTFDQYGNTSLDPDKEKRFSPEQQLFLEPGDYRVREYTGNIVKEILTRYPDFSGIHLDYIRYPVAVPYIPGSRFTNQGLSYGYNKFNLLNFQKATGLDPRTMDMSSQNCFLWDNWRREQVTKLLTYLSQEARSVAPGIKISCALVPSVDKTYLITFQNWHEWLKKGLCDHVVFMNYTTDPEYMKIQSEALVSPKLKNKIHMGVGAYMLKNDIKTLKDEILSTKELSPAGIVLFSYDDVVGNEELKTFLSENFAEPSTGTPQKP